MKVKDKGKKKLLAQIKKMEKAKIQIGAVGKHSSTDLTNAELMLIHEFGAPKAGIKARRPISKTFTSSDKLDIIIKNFRGLLKQNFNPKKKRFNVDKILQGVGETMRALLVATIQQGVSPNILDSSRKQRRGSKTTPPLIDTEEMIRHIMFRVVT